MNYLRSILYGPILVLKLLILGAIYCAYAGCWIALAISSLKFVPWLIEFSKIYVGNTGWILAIFLPGLLGYLLVCATIISAIFTPLLSLAAWAFRPEYEAVTSAANHVYHDVVD